jgi:predicted acetyltransferase/ribosomal protein S18 acetylase RimI-like enzyme
MTVALSPMLPEHAERFSRMLAEFRAHGEVGLYTGFYAAAWDGYEAYRETVRRVCAGGWPFAEVVPGAVFFVMAGDEIVGELYLRFGLTDELERDGGNVGYQSRPAARNNGYATKALRLGLARLAERGIISALVTCDDRNLPSIRVIEKSGGERLDDAALDGGKRNRRYAVATVTARALVSDDWDALRAIRLRALREEPGMFFRSYDEEVALTEDAWRDRIAGPRHQVFGLFAGDELAGITAVVPHWDDATETTASLAMSYLAPAYRGHGYTRFLYAVRLAWIRGQPTVRRVVVSHRASNVASGRAIRAHGFRCTGSAPHQWPDGIVDDEIFYELLLDGEITGPEPDRSR